MDELNKVLPAAVVEFGGRLIGAALILFVGWIVVRYFTPPLRRTLERSRLDPTFASFLTSTARAAFVVMLIVAAMQQLGLQTASVLTLLGTVGLALGVLLVLPILGIIGPVHDWLPSSLVTAPVSLVDGAGLSTFLPALASCAAGVVALTAFAAHRLGRREV